ncbi:helix-turn-helix transcriptional regulator [bacterium]|nr:helix-turn-helix transcriptional regulator [bacterium]MBQ9246003.1 helix-turn-helix transcriptional regulator [bacterium]MBQ9246894.1 helix-turn-helix transcriptional regulator [bacterium]
MDKQLLRKLAKRVKELRKLNGYTQDDLSACSNIARSTLGNIETASNDITFSKVNQLAKAFNMSLAEFLNF